MVNRFHQEKYIRKCKECRSVVNDYCRGRERNQRRGEGEESNSERAMKREKSTDKESKGEEGRER